jgi:hypothetical protein
MLRRTRSAATLLEFAPATARAGVVPASSAHFVAPSADPIPRHQPIETSPFQPHRLLPYRARRVRRDQSSSQRFGASLAQSGVSCSRFRYRLLEGFERCRTTRPRKTERGGYGVGSDDGEDLSERQEKPSGKARRRELHVPADRSDGLKPIDFAIRERQRQRRNVTPLIFVHLARNAD